MTGHEDGPIAVNLAEADDAAREAALGDGRELSNAAWRFAP